MFIIQSHTYLLFMALYGVVMSCDVCGLELVDSAQVRPAQGVASVKEQMLQSNKDSEEKNPTSANTVPRSLV